MAAPTQTFNLAKPVKVQNPTMALDADLGPYDSVEDACTAITKDWRVLGKEVRILVDGAIKPYYWKSGIEDSDLVPFGGEGGECNLHIGTSAERAAFSAKEGDVWNDVEQTYAYDESRVVYKYADIEAYFEAHKTHFPIAGENAMAVKVGDIKISVDGEEKYGLVLLTNSEVPGVMSHYRTKTLKLVIWNDQHSDVSIYDSLNVFGKLGTGNVWEAGTGLYRCNTYKPGGGAGGATINNFTFIGEYSPSGLALTDEFKPLVYKRVVSSEVYVNSYVYKEGSWQLYFVDGRIEDEVARAKGYADSAATSLSTMQSTLTAGIATGIEQGAAPTIARAENYADRAGLQAERATAKAQEAANVVAQNYAFTGEGTVRDFDVAVLFKENELVRYQNKYYRCVIEHVGAWRENDFVQTTLYQELQRLEGGDKEEIVLVQVGFHGAAPAGFDFRTVRVFITDHTTGETEEHNLDENGQYEFVVKYGDRYTVSISDLEGYFTPEAITHTASIIERPIPFMYHAGTEESAGVIFAQSSDPKVETFGQTAVLERILGEGTYVIDEVHKKYAKLSAIDHNYFSDGTTYTGKYGNSFRHIPRVYFRGTGSSATEYRLLLSDLPISDKFWEDSWIGTYKGYRDGNGLLRSLKGYAATGNITMSAFWNAAQLNGSHYGLVNVFDQFKLIALHAAFFGTRNSDETMGPGLCDGGSVADYYNPTSGYTAALGDRTGSMRYKTSIFNMNKLFGIECLAGAQWEFRPNVRFTSNQIIFYDGNIVSNEAPGRTIPRTLVTASSAYITDMEFGDYCDLLPKAAGSGSSVTHWCDATWAASNGALLLVGGRSYIGSRGGLSAASSSDEFSNAYATYGARLAFRGNIDDYDLVSGEELARLNS